MLPQKKLALAIAAVVLLVVVLFVLIAKRDPGRDGAPTGGLFPAAPSTSQQAPEAPTTISGELTAPGPDIDHRAVRPAIGAVTPPSLEYTYVLATELPTLQVQAVALDVYRTVDEAYARELARVYGMSDREPFIEGDTYVFTGDLLRAGAGVLRINGRSGYSSYMIVNSGPPVSTVRAPADAVRLAQAFLQKTGQLAPNLDPPVTYQRTSVPGVTFVEYHRSWDPLPILEPTGLLTASPTDRDANRPDHEDIVRTSDRTDGKARPADFNTITVAVDQQGRIIVANVRMRPIDRTLPARALKAPQQAWEELRDGKGILGFTLPSETNISQRSWNEVFPDGKAVSEDAQVREVVAAFVERPDGVRQTYLQPVYVFKGRAKLASGPLADFIVAVPALEDDSLPTT